MSQVQAKQREFPVSHSVEEWKRILTPEQFHIMREHGTERAGSCALNFEKRAGTFSCAGRASTIRCPARSKPSPTGPGAWSAPKRIAAAAVRTSAMSSKTARRRPDCAIA
jgi:peptide-methionine (R)-S-oxide reductase